MPRFTPVTEKALLAAGWFEGRTVPDEVMKDWLVINWLSGILAPCGYSEISPVAWRVLKEFGGLSIARTGGQDGDHPFMLNPLLVPDSGAYGRGLRKFSWEIGIDLFPLGTIRLDLVLDAPVTFIQAVAIGGDGRVFLLRSPNCLLGNSIEEALENIVVGKVSEVIEAPEREQAISVALDIDERIEERELQLINGQWPDQPTTLNDQNNGYYAVHDWNAEACLIRRAFGIARPCSFFGSPILKSFLPTEENRDIRTRVVNDDDDGYNYRASLGNGLILQLLYAPHCRYIAVRNTVNDTAATIELQCDGSFLIQGVELTQLSLVLAKGLFNLGLLTPEIEERLYLTLTLHEKLEWQLEFEASQEG